MNTTTSNNPKPSNHVASVVRTLAVSLALFLGLATSAFGQEIFILSTESGLELYQVEKLHEPNLQLNTFRPAFGSNLVDQSFMHQPTVSAYGIMGKSFMVNSGLQTTPNGRLLMLAGETDWRPSSGSDTDGQEFVASLLSADNLRTK